MSIIRHHFHKEASYLLSRWLPWLGLLGLDLAINLELLAPGSTLPTWLSWIPWAVWIGAALLVCSDPPEDHPSDHNAFLRTRPVPVRAYWVGRALVLTLLVALPLALQEVLYLWLSSRPLNDALMGGFSKWMAALAVLGWLIPGSVLLRWKWLIVAGALFSAGYHLAERLLSYLPGSWIVYLGWRDDPSDYTPILALVVLALLLVAACIWYNGRTPQLAKCLASAGLMGFLGNYALHLCQLNPLQATDQQRAEQLAAQTKIEMPLNTLGLSSNFTGPDKNERGLSLKPQVHCPDPFVVVDLQQQAFAWRAGGGEWRGKKRNKSRNKPDLAGIWFENQTGFNLRHARTSMFPAGTLFVGNLDSGGHWNGGGGSLAQEALDSRKPLQMHGEYRQDWTAWSLAVNLPLQTGARADTPRSRWTIEDVQLNKDHEGKEVPGAVTVVYRVAWQSRPGDTRVGGMQGPALHAPDRRMVWLPKGDFNNKDKKSGSRKADWTNWKRQTMIQTWRNVLTYADGEPAKVKPAKLRFVVMDYEYLGSTLWSLEMPAFTPANYLEDEDLEGYWILHDNPGIYALGDVAAFAKRLTELQPIGPTSSGEVVRRYLYDLLTAATVTSIWRNEQGGTLFKQALAPVAEHHVEILLSLSSQAMRASNSELPKIIAGVLTEEHKTAVLANVNRQPWLAQVVESHHWEDEALPYLRQIKDYHGHLDYQLVKLLMKLEDEGINNILIRHWQQHSSSFMSIEILRKFGSNPFWRSELKNLGKDLWREVAPTVEGGSIYAFAISARLGSREALDFCLALAKQGEHSYSDPGSWPVNQMASCVGVKNVKTEDEAEQLIKEFRQLSVDDFVYSPEKLQWEKKAP